MALERMRIRHEGVEYYIIDEFSMLGCHSLAMISQVLTQIKATHDSNLFGNVSIILVGDLRQLPPIGDKPLYATKRFQGTKEASIETGR